MQTFRFPCPHCKGQLALSEEHRGKQARCPHCQRVFAAPPPIPPPVATPPPPPPATVVRYDRTTDTFVGTMPQVMRLAVKAIHSIGYKVDNANETFGILTFQTGMTWGSWSGVTASLQFEDAPGGRIKVSGSAKQNLSGGQVLALNLFGEAQRKVTKVIDEMARIAAS